MIAFLTICLCFSLSQCVEISQVLHNLVTDVRNEEFSRVNCKGSSSTTKSGMPHYLTCSFSYMGEEVKIHLNRNNPERYRMPVYSVTDDRIEQEMGNDINTKSSLVDFYQNQNGTATFKVAKIKDESGEHFTLTGYIFKNMSHVIMHPFPGTKEHRVFVPRNMHHTADSLYDETDTRSGLTSDVYKRVPVTGSSTTRLQTAEILVVVDYKFYSKLVLNETEFTHGTTSGISSFLSEYIALLFDTTNIPYRNLVSDGIHLVLKPVGIVVAKSKSASPWTEQSLLNSTEYPDFVNGGQALHKFHNYILHSKALPPHDHALLLTGFRMKRINSTNTNLLGIASTSAMCGPKSQSVVSAHFDFTPAFTIAHELGHSFGCEHDGENNTCPQDGHVMNSTSARNTSNIWQFSSCSISYIKTLLNKLDRTHKNCLLTQQNQAVDHQLTVHEHEFYGQIYSADQQCQIYLGPESYMERDDFNFTGAYQTAFCLQMVCYDPVNHEHFDRYAVPGDGTTCGHQKWCMAGACVHQPTLTHSTDICPQGEVPDHWLRADYYEDSPSLHSYNFTSSCKAYVQQRPEQCYLAKIKYSCCQSCSKIPQYTNEVLPESVYNSVLPEDSQCKQMFGSSSYYCGRRVYADGVPDPFCTALRCYLPSDDLCHHIVAQDGTRCSYNKWCVAGQCVDDPRALLPVDYRNVPSPQRQCEDSYGVNAHFCGRTSTYSTNYHQICKKLYCILPEQPLCHSIMALDGTPCGTKMICQQGQCVHSEHGLDLPDDCLYVDKSSWCATNIHGPDTAYKCAFSHNADLCCFTCQKYANMSMPADCRYGDELSYTRYHLTCDQLVTPSPQQCYESSVKQRCCQSCYNAAPSLPGKSTPPSLDKQCQVLFGSSSYFCKGVDDYSTSFEPLCGTMYCADASGRMCHGIIAADRTPCGPKKWCLNGTCVHDDKAPNIPNSCVAGDLHGWCSTKKTDGSYKYSYVCYTHQKDECCDMCNKVHDPSNKGCEYGDHNMSCDRSKCSTYNDNSRNVLCCKTCA